MSKAFNGIFFDYIEEQAERGRRAKRVLPTAEEMEAAQLDHVMCDVQSMERESEEHAE
jgi:hypothetical protein